MPLARRAKVLHSHPCGLLALEKPVNIKTHPNKPGEKKGCLLLADYSSKMEAYRIDDSRYLYILNRLDSPTSGIVLAATELKVAKAVRAVFKAQQVKKEYIAVVVGRMTNDKAAWSDKLQRTRDAQQKLRVRQGGDVKAVTDVEVLVRNRAILKLRLMPRTGRTHQLRVQCAHRNLPVIGDKTYGDFASNRDYRKLTGEKRLFLHAAKISLAFELDGKDFSFEASSLLPEAFDKIIDLVE